LARRATFIQQVRDQNPYVLLLDAGNALISMEGIGATTEGQAIVEGMNRVGYDAMTLGDQDFRLGIDTLRELIAEAHFPFLSANVYVGNTQTLFAEPYRIVNMAGHRIAIIGVTNKDLVSFLSGGGAEPVLVSEPIQSIRNVLADLAGKADIVIVCSNLGYDQDRELAAQVPGITAIIGGNPGMLMPEPYRDPTYGALIVQAGYQGEWIGKLTLQIDEKGQVTSYQGEAVVLGQEIADDAAIRAWLDTFPTPQPY